MHYSLYVLILAIVLLLTNDASTQLELVINWSIVSLGVQIPFTAYFYRLVRNQFSLSIDAKTSVKYLLTSIIVFGVVYLISEEFLVYHESIFHFLLNLILYFALGVLMYALITFSIDLRTRNLAKAIIKELRKSSN